MIYQENDVISYEDYILRMPNGVFLVCPLQKYYLIDTLQFNATFDCYSTYLSRIC